MEVVDADEFLMAALPALHSDEGPPFATEPELKGYGAFALLGLFAILIRDN